MIVIVLSLSPDPISSTHKLNVSAYAGKLILNKDTNKNLQNISRNSEQIMINKITGLMWQKNRSKKKYTWKRAKKYCGDLVYDGYNDWRLPSKQEYKDLLLMFSKKNDTSDDNRTNIKTVDLKIKWHSPWYWTSTKYNSTQIWIFNAFIDGDRYSNLKKEYLVNCVRK